MTPNTGAGYYGEGVQIGIIDTGIDYQHPTLGGGFGPGFKVAGGYDFVGDKYGKGNNPPVPDNDPLDLCAGHGTHVSSAAFSILLIPRNLMLPRIGGRDHWRQPRRYL